MRPLSQVKQNEQVLIKEINCPNPLKRHMMDMGLTQGTYVKVKKVAPLGDPMELFLRGYSLTIRKQDAKQILVDER